MQRLAQSLNVDVTKKQLLFSNDVSFSGAHILCGQELPPDRPLLLNARQEVTPDATVYLCGQDLRPDRPPDRHP